MPTMRSTADPSRAHRPPKSSLPDARALAALRARIERQYATVTENISVGDLVLTFTRVARPDQVLEEMELSADEARFGQPYWAQAWESAHAIGEQLVELRLAGRRVMDLGCGMGLAGTVAAACGAEVLMADAATPALLFARLNSWNWRARVGTRRIDWRRDRLPGLAFDLILGADVLYDVSDWPFLERFWRAHLRDQGRVLLGEPGRRPSDDFTDWLSQRGWQLNEFAAAIRLWTATIQESE